MSPAKKRHEKEALHRAWWLFVKTLTATLYYHLPPHFPSLPPTLPTQLCSPTHVSRLHLCRTSWTSPLSPSSTRSPLSFHLYSILVQATGSARVLPMLASPSRWSGSDACGSSAASSASTVTPRRSTSTSTTTSTCGTCCRSTLPPSSPRSLHSHYECLFALRGVNGTLTPRLISPSPPSLPPLLAV